MSLYQNSGAMDRAIGKAKQIERRLRDCAFLPIHEQIAGVPVKQLTLRHLSILLSIDSPFVGGHNRRTAASVAQFLWVVSPGYNQRQLGRRDFIATIAPLPGTTLARGIDRYLDRALMDRPPSTTSARPMVSASFVASLVVRIAQEFGWDDEQIMDKPISRLFQYLCVLRAGTNEKAPQFHIFSDRLRAISLAKRQRAKERKG